MIKICVVALRSCFQPTINQCLEAAAHIPFINDITALFKAVEVIV